MKKKIWLWFGALIIGIIGLVLNYLISKWQNDRLFKKIQAEINALKQK